MQHVQYSSTQCSTTLIQSNELTQLTPFASALPLSLCCRCNRNVQRWKGKASHYTRYKLFTNDSSFSFYLVVIKGLSRYEPGAKLGKHLDEHHEETKGVKGWLLPSCRSVTWLLYLNDNWTIDDGGALCCYVRDGISSHPVRCYEGNIQVGWMDHSHPLYLNCFRKSGMSALY